MHLVPGSRLQRKMFARAFLTALCTEFTQIIALTIDSIIICVFFEDSDIAAVGLASPFFYLVGISAACFGTGFQTVCSREMGRGRISELNRVFSQSVLFTVISMAMLTIVVFLNIPIIAQAFGTWGGFADLRPATEQYLYGLAFEIVPFVLLSALTAVVILDNGSKVAMASSILGGVANVGFDILAVRFHWGLFGIGLGSSLSAVVSLAVVLTHFLHRGRVLRFRFMRIRLSVIRSVIRAGGPSSVHALACMLRVLALNAIASRVGNDLAVTAVAVLAILSTILDFIDIPAAGVQNAAGILFGIGYGENNGADLEDIGALAHRYIGIISAVTMTVLFAFMHPIATIFLEPDSAGIPLLHFAIGCAAVSAGFSALIYARVSYLQATNKVRSARRLEELANFVLMVLFAMLLSFPFGAYGIFAAYPLSKIVSLAVVYVRCGVRSHRLIPAVRDYMELGPAFYPDASDIISVPIDSLDHCVQVSKSIVGLCARHGFSDVPAMISGLCAEEIATNIFQHGGKREEELHAEIRAAVADGVLIMRVRDNGMAFNMNALAKILSEAKTPFANFGIRIICNAATEIGYYNIYNMNTTVIRINPEQWNR